MSPTPWTRPRRPRLRREHCGGGGRSVIRFIDEQERRENRGRQQLAWPLYPNVYCTIDLPTPIEPDEWDQLMRLFAAAEPALVKRSAWSEHVEGDPHA